LGLAEAVLPHAVQVDNSRSVVAAVRAGQADVGLVYASDAVRATGCRVLFRARRGRPAIRYAAAVLERSAQPAEARALLAFLTSPDAAGRFRGCGFGLTEPEA
jgi:molybdate transport system substrate-binding protein